MQTTHKLQRMLSPDRGRGKELCDMLRRELALPDNCSSFEVAFEMNEVVLVRCTYLAVERDEGDA